jgi:cell division protein FtsL
MLDTRMPPVSTRTRRSQSSARPESRFQARPATSPRPEERTAREQFAEPARRALPSARTNRLARSEMRLMGLATACTAGVCALLLLYLAAYAHVTQLGIAQAQARTQLHQNQLRNELLQAERNSLESPQRIDAAAAMQGMTPRGATPVNYISVHRSILAQQRTEQPGGETASVWDQGNSSGTTEDSSQSASRDH